MRKPLPKTATPDTVDPFQLTPRRVHEATGPGAVVFALMQAGRTPGPVVWISPAHSMQHLLPWGLPPDLNHRLLMLRPTSEADLLWTTEEALRSTAVAMVIAEPAKPMSLIAGRRLQLAAEAGRSTGLMLIREGAGSNAAETRWHCAPLLRPDAAPEDSTRHHWVLVKNKKGTVGGWVVPLDGKMLIGVEQGCRSRGDRLPKRGLPRSA